MSNNAYFGAGSNFSSKFYIRNYYSSNRDAAAVSTRSNFSSTELASADAAALRRAVKKLGSFSFEDSDSTNVRNGAKAFIDTYNNLLSSSADASDSSLRKNTKNLKALVSEHADEFEKIGITVNEDGTLTERETLLAVADLSKFEKLFSGDSDFCQKAAVYAKRLERKASEVLLNEKNTALNNKKRAAQAASPVDLDTLLHTGIGSNINISL